VICFPYHLRFHPWKQTPSSLLKKILLKTYKSM
jgi:hypothetical protein